MAMSLGKSTNCVICRKPAIPRSPYRPRPLVATEAESAASP
jgi:hypothetical protein